MTPPIPIPRELLERLTQYAKKLYAISDDDALDRVLDPDIDAAEELLAKANETSLLATIPPPLAFKSPPSRPPVHRIADGGVIPFPCWLWNYNGKFTVSGNPKWIRFDEPINAETEYHFSHWSPDSPTAPQPPREGV